jgi:uncharacterized protein (DUF983 family)
VNPPSLGASNSLRVLRALRLDCPECGGGGLFRRWLLIRSRCATCALRLDRADPDHFVGAYLVNLIAAELLFAAGLAFWVMCAWPDVPWDRIEVVGVPVLIAAPFVSYPFSRTLWLAADRIFDPPKARDRE